MFERIKQLCENWPSDDAARWLAFVGPKTPAQLRQLPKKTKPWRHHTIYDYTIWWNNGINWQRSNKLLKPKAPAAHRWNAATLERFVRHLKGQYGGSERKTSTIYFQLVGIERVLATLDPDADRRFIKDQTSKVARHSKSTDKSERLQDVRELFDCGTTLMRTATRERGDKHEAALTYRTGLQIALLARRPLRLSNFANLRIGEHIRSLPLTDGFHIMLEPDETKAHKAVTIGFPDDLVEAYEKYLVQWRPLIPPVRPKDDEKHVWLSISGGRQSKIDLYRKIVGATADYFQLEKGINPHLFRDCLATSLSLLDPGEWPIAYQILGNTPTMVERFYDHSSTLRASETGSDFLDALITKLKS